MSDKKSNDIKKMHREVSIHEAKTHLSTLLAQVVGGEEITITKSGKPLAKIIPLKQIVNRPKAGKDVGKITITDDFFASLPDGIEEEFYK